MQEHHLRVPRSARYFTLGGGSRGVAEVWFVCHGYGQLASRFVQKFEVLADGRRLILAPEGLSRFYVDEPHQKVGASWMTREDRLTEIEDYVRYLDALCAEVFRTLPRAGVRVSALGFSQGAATVCRWATLGMSRVDRLIVWGGEVPPDLDLPAVADRLRALRLWLVYGRHDEFFTPKVIATTEARLRDHGIPYDLVPFDGGHEIDPTVLTELAGA